MKVRNVIFSFFLVMISAYSSLVIAGTYRANGGGSCVTSPDNAESCINFAAEQNCSSPNTVKDPIIVVTDTRYAVSPVCQTCDKGGTYIGQRLCLKDEVCPPPKVYRNGSCQSPCPNGSIQNARGECSKPPEEKNCGGQGANPIDYSSGEKLRHEHVISTGTRHPLTFMFYYNNHSNHENTVAGIVANRPLANTVLNMSDPISSLAYAADYNEKGLEKTTTLSIQYYGSIEQYWRHNFDDVLQIRRSDYQLHLANGEMRTFDGLGASKTHPVESLLALNVGEESFDGYKWINHKTGKEKRFDKAGKLRKITNASSDAIVLSYTNDQLTSIENRYGESLSIQYDAFDINSIYAQQDTQHHFPVKITASNGRSASLGWNANFRGQTATFHLLTRITDATNGTATTARDFSYTDSRWPASITQIHTVSNIASNTKSLYAEFKYDDQGRAIYSSLANGAEAVTVEYTNDLTRTVTNELGKDATYTFEFIDGVKKLKKVIGEPTSSCLRSEVEYIYNTDGTVFEKKQNGKTTRYSAYDSKKRETKRVEAFNTSEARIITTDWHPTHNLKTKVMEPKTTTEWEYFADGKLKATKTYATQN